MTTAVAQDRGALAFAEKLLIMLGHGRFTSTYKYAVILGLMDLCLEQSSRSGRAPTSVTSTQLAYKVVELYWTHTRAFEPRVGAPVVLDQNAGPRRAGILRLIEQFQEGARDPSAPLARQRIRDAKGFGGLCRAVEWVLVQMPLPKLQRVGATSEPFLYRISWSDDVRKSDWRKDDFDNVIRFVSGTGDHLVRLAGLVRPLVQNGWAERVARLNRGVVDEPELADFLFGEDRVSTARLRTRLRELGDDRCFYCREQFGTSCQLDHFIPWARYPDNGIQNLVPAHQRCNGSKSDHIAAAAHLERWVRRARARGGDLAELATEVGWESRPERTLGVARSIYLRLPDDAFLWKRSDEFVHVDRPLIERAFAG